MTLNLTTLKSAADLAKTDPVEMDIWRESVIEPDDVLRLVEVARLAREVRQIEDTHTNASAAFYMASVRLYQALEGIEP